MGRRVEQAIAILNGAVGDYLHRQGNGLATSMSWAQGGAVVGKGADVLARAYPQATSRVVVLVHGLMCTESIFRFADGRDYGTMLAEDFGFTPLYLRYNSGLSIASNGAALATRLTELCVQYPGPVDEILLLGHSMGGLVIRRAIECGGPWLARVRRNIYIATPHGGAPLEQGGRVLRRWLARVPDPYAQLVGELADLRSRGVKDLGDALGRAPLGAGMAHLLIAGSLGRPPLLAQWLGDAVVPTASATAAHLRWHDESHGRDESRRRNGSAERDESRGRDGSAERDESCRRNGSAERDESRGRDDARVHAAIVRGVAHGGLARHLDVYAHIRRFVQEPL